MNRGKNDNLKPSPVDRLNQRLARLFGKRENKHPPRSPAEIPSNNRFMLLILVMLLLLWGLTGFYYIPKASYGLILHNGKVHQLVSGVNVGFTYPYPLGSVAILDAGLAKITFGSESHNPYSVMTQDQQEFTLSVSATYYINRPQVYYANFYQEDSDLDQQMEWLLQAAILEYSSRHSTHELTTASTIVVANEIRQLSNRGLAKYGLSWEKITINRLARHEIEPPVSSSTLGQQALAQAQKYQQQLSESTTLLVREFNQLLPQYHANPQAIVELMYYKMLSQVPSRVSSESYPLLSLTPEQFIAQLSESATHEVVSSKLPTDLRQVDRSVNRQRRWEGR